MMKLSDEQFASIRRMYRTIAPEREDRQLYLLDANDAPRSLRSFACENLGWAVRGFASLAFADAIGSEWAGMGDVVVLAADQIAAESTNGFERKLLAVAIHEAGHLLPSRGGRMERAPKPPAIDLQQTMAARLMTVPVATDDEPIRDPHDSAFVRRTIHLWYRAALAGFDAGLDGVLGWREGRSADACYLSALLEECHRLRAATFAEIEAEPAPPRFTELWNQDLKRIEL